MATRVPASQRTREELTVLIEGRLSMASAKDELVKLATRLIVEEALEGEATDAVGREYYEPAAPQIAGRDEPFRSAIREHLKGQTQGLEELAIEVLARGRGAKTCASPLDHPVLSLPISASSSR
jgi:putative transposase